ncbi:MAG: hypothetical protein HC802_07590, partial [Caldilineaceae bacterium]|nr:hypothetical protein [Caldilineaceae bacterium]
MRVAVITPYLPWPADTGGKLRSFYLLKGLTEVADVDLFTVCYGPTPSAGRPADLCNSVSILAMQNRSPRREFWEAWFNPIPKAVRHFASPATVRAVQRRISNGYDLLVCDEICMTPYVDFLAERGSPSDHPPRLVMRQKVDYLHYRETAEQRPMGLEKELDRLESRRLERYERAKMPLFQAAVVCS